jgi:hypothetical protein
MMMDFTQVDMQSLCLGALAWWVWSIIVSRCRYYLIGLVAYIGKDTRETTIEVIVDRCRMVADKRLPYWRLSK